MECIHCNSILSSADITFCPNCGQKPQVEIEKYENIFHNRNFYLISAYYLITLLTLGLFKFTKLFEDDMQSVFILDSFLSILTVAFLSLFYRKDFQLYKFKRIKISHFVSLIAIVLVGAFIINVVVKFINTFLFGVDLVYSEVFLESQYPFLLSIIFICIQPAIFEEMAFRGFIYSGLQEMANKETAIFISSFLFAIMHLSIISLPWLIGIGLLFCWFRNKYNTLWYGMIGHALFNFVAVVMEFYF